MHLHQSLWLPERGRSLGDECTKLQRGGFYLKQNKADKIMQKKHIQ